MVYTVVTRVTEQLAIKDLRKLEHISKISKLHRFYSLVLSLPPEMNFFFNTSKELVKNRN